MRARCCVVRWRPSQQVMGSTNGALGQPRGWLRDEVIVPIQICGSGLVAGIDPAEHAHDSQ